MRFLSFFFSITVPLIADVPACNSGVFTFDPPQNRSVVTWYPSNFTTMTPIFPERYECEYQVNVPEGWFVRIILSVFCLSGVPIEAPVVITDQLQRTERVSNVDEQRFYFISPGGKIKLTTEEERVQFGFSLFWQKYTNTPSIQLNISSSDTQPTLLESNGMKAAVVKADTKVSATILSPVYNYLIQNLRNIVFFDGDSWNATSLGTGLQLLNGKTQFVSTGKFMTVLLLESFYYEYGQIVLQDYEHTKYIVDFQGLKCTLYTKCGSFELDASKGPAVFQMHNHNHSLVANVLTGISGTGNLDVYIGGVTTNKSNLIASYDSETDNNLNFPQEFLGAFKTFVLTGGKANITMTETSKTFRKTFSLPRKGFIASEQYGSLSISQDSHSIVMSPVGTTAKFSYSIRDADCNQYALLSVAGYTNGTLLFFKFYDKDHLPPAKIEFYGETMDVEYKAFGMPNEGFCLDFEMLNSAPQLKLLSVLFFISVAHFLWNYCK